MEIKTAHLDLRANQEFDHKHSMGSTFVRRDEDSLNVVRCMGCRSLNTEWHIRMLGSCHSCGGTKFNGASPNKLEWLRIQWWYITRNWRSRGWKTAEERDAIRRKLNA